MNAPLPNNPLFLVLKPAGLEGKRQHKRSLDQAPAGANQNDGDDEWTKMYPFIRELYIDEGNKLQKVMRLMESRHNFEASAQMYKKRLTRWGLFKNKRAGAVRPVADQPPSTSLQVSESRSYRIGRTRYIQAAPIAAPLTVHAHTGILKTLAGISEWNTSCCEGLSRAASHQRSPGEPVRGLSSPMRASGLLYRTFQCAGELLHRGEGLLAGKAIRKAFLQLEDVVEDASPELMLRLLSIQFILVLMGHRGLADQLLSHLGRLAALRLSLNHPLRKVISGLLESKGDLLRLIKQAWLCNFNTLKEHTGPSHLWACLLSITQGPDTVTDIKTVRARMEGFVRRALEESMDTPTTTGNILQAGDNFTVNREPLRYHGNKTTTSTGTSGAHIQVKANEMETSARVAELRNDWVQAEEDLRVALKLAEHAHGVNSPSGVRLLLNTENVLMRAGKPEEAAAIRKQAVQRMSIYVQDVPDLI